MEGGGPLRVLVLGAGGRLGGMLRRHWGTGAGAGLVGADLAPLWQMRGAVEGPEVVRFDPLGRWPALGRVDVVICLAGVIAGDAAALRVNTDLALAAVRQGARCGAGRVFLASTAAVYGRGGAGLAEDDPVVPVSRYGQAKRAMELAALAAGDEAGVPVTVLRIGNVAGADALLGGLAQGRVGRGPVVLDRFADGQGPRRSYIGPGGFAAAMAGLARAAGAGCEVPACLNLALPGAVAMADLLQAAGVAFDWRAAPAGALPLVELDVGRLLRLVPLERARAGAIVAEWRGAAAV
ncbi:MAG: NAD-dependent epimerase/dehydratase family protein [Alphaproteobacteria bacterium]